MKLFPFIITICLTFLIVTPLPASSDDKPSSKTITVCSFELTELGKGANFRFDYTYAVETNKDDAVERVTKIGKEDHPAFVREDKIIECIKTWKLAPSSRYIVIFNLGTHGGSNDISITDSDGSSIKIVMS